MCDYSLYCLFLCFNQVTIHSSSRQLLKLRKDTAKIGIFCEPKLFNVINFMFSLIFVIFSICTSLTIASTSCKVMLSLMMYKS